MRSSVTRPDFLARPAGTWYAGRQCMAFSRDPTLCGNVVWGHLDQPLVAELIDLFELARPPHTADSFRVLTDFSGVDGVDPAGFEALTSYLQGRRDELFQRVERHALVHPAGLEGSVLIGQLARLQAPPGWRAFDNLGAAWDWLGCGPALAAEIAAAVSSARSGDRIVRAVRERVAGVGYLEATLPAVAAQLALSTRTLQRVLRAAGTSFRRELDRARLRHAAELIAHPNLKLDAVARTCGYSSESHLARAFRRTHAMAPTAWRAARAG